MAPPPIAYAMPQQQYVQPMNYPPSAYSPNPAQWDPRLQIDPRMQQQPNNFPQNPNFQVQNYQNSTSPFNPMEKQQQEISGNSNHESAIISNFNSTVSNSGQNVGANANGNHGNYGNQGNQQLNNGVGGHSGFQVSSAVSTPVSGPNMHHQLDNHETRYRSMKKELQNIDREEHALDARMQLLEDKKRHY